jgi:hypothetical protein
MKTKEIHRYSIALRDFENAKRYICAMRKHLPSSTEYEALLFATIVSYYRPFSRNEKAQSAEATSQLCNKEFNFLTESQIALHELCKELRNQALAHSEFKHNPTKYNPKTGVFSSRPFSLLSQDFDLVSFEMMLTQVMDFCHKKRAEFSNSQKCS